MYITVITSFTMGYFTNYDPFTGAPCNQPVFYTAATSADSGDDDACHTYRFNGTRYTIDRPTPRVPSTLPVALTKPYHWMCTEPIVVLFQDGSTKT